MQSARRRTHVENVLPANADDDTLAAAVRDTSWYSHPFIMWSLQGCAVLSLISVCCNTPKTFKEYPCLLYTTYGVDIFLLIVFTAEMSVKVWNRGLIHAKTRAKNAYLRSHWCRFDVAMLLALLLSVIIHTIQVVEGTDPATTALTDKPDNGYRSIVRAPRPLIVVRLFRVLLNVKLPTARISQILKRSSQQIMNVTLFFLFFMSLYGILGVQFFGDLNYHCVLNSFNETAMRNGEVELYTKDLAIPDKPCTPRSDSRYGYVCQDGMKCIGLPFEYVGYTTFKHFPISFFSVYNAGSQEGWSSVMYQAIDTLESWKAYLYFISLIVFLAWLVKNVFIAVIIETFAEIRVQFQQMWGSQETAAGRPTMVLANEEHGWKLISLDEQKPHGLAPAFLQRWVRSPVFNTIFMIIVLADAVSAACRGYIKVNSNQDPKDTLYWFQVAFTAIFDIEVLLKVWCYSPRGYFRRSQHKLELVLAVFSTIHVIPDLYRKYALTYFQVVRVFRLIKASPVLEEFCWKIFGPAKKLGSLVVFTMAILFITSGISLQLFCYVRDVAKDDSENDTRIFGDFPRALLSVFQVLTGEGWVEMMQELMTEQASSNTATAEIGPPCIAGYFVVMHFAMTAALLSMFQILLKKGWTDIMHKTLLSAGEFGAAFVAIIFVCYHLLITVIILSLFVAVILDNLEMAEETKRIRQLKDREESTELQQTLPLRLRVFEKFSNQPQMVNVAKRVACDSFTAPKVRESFMRGFVDCHDNNNLRLRSQTMVPIRQELSDIHLLCGKPASKTLSEKYKKTEISTLISDSSQQRSMHASDPVIPRGGANMPAPPNQLHNNNATIRALMRRSMLPFEDNASGMGNRVNRNPRMISNGSAGSVMTSAQRPSGNMTVKRPGDDIDIQILQQKKQQAEIKRNQQESELRENHPWFDTPLFMVGRESKFREFCHVIVSARCPATGKDKKSKYKDLERLRKIVSLVPFLDWLMILITIISCIMMMFETPHKRVIDCDNVSFRIVEYVFVIAMSIEMMLKMFANGLFFTPNALVRDVGGALDMIIYFISLVFLCSMIMPGPGKVGYLSYGHVILILRCTRPLRIFILLPPIRKVIYELVRGFKEILLVSILLFGLVFVFASYGVQRYGGELKACNDPTVKNQSACVGIFFRTVQVTSMNVKHLAGERPGYWVPRVWANPYNFNFDNIGAAILALFEVLSLEGWLEIRDIIIARMGAGEAVYVHVFVFLGVLIGLTLFVGVVISNYSQNKGTALLTVDQRRWLDLKGRINLTQPLHVPPRPEKNKIREIVFDITQHRFFKRAVAVLVALNSLLLVLPWYTNIQDIEKKPKYTKYLTGGGAAFVALFLVEVIMKTIALSPKGYWYSRRNRFDLLVTTVGVVWVILHIALSKEHPDEINSFGYFVIILRFFTITGKHATLKMLMLTIVVSMIKSFFLVSGMFLLMLCYAYSGVLMFGSVRYGENLNRHANFRTVSQAIVLLFRIVTGEDWNKIMHDCMISEPYCFGKSSVNSNYWQVDCGHAVLSGIYFCSFYVIITYIMLNLLVAIIMENFSLFYSNEEDALLSYSDIRHYQNTWNMMDFDRRGSIPIKRVPVLLRLLKGASSTKFMRNLFQRRLEIDLSNHTTRMLFRHMCYEIQHLHGGPSGFATFHDVLTMLSYRSVDIRKSLQLEELLVREDLEITISEEVAKQILTQWLTNCIRRRRARGHIDLMRRPTQEPFYVVTEAEETPLMEATVIDSPESAAESPVKLRKTSETAGGSGLQLPKKGSSSFSESSRERVKRMSLSGRMQFSNGMNETVAKKKTEDVNQWFTEQLE